jgi:hypothetical protein
MLIWAQVLGYQATARTASSFRRLERLNCAPHEYVLPNVWFFIDVTKC